MLGRNPGQPSKMTKLGVGTATFQGHSGFLDLTITCRGVELLKVQANIKEWY